jgi:recombination protein RecT
MATMNLAEMKQQAQPKSKADLAAMRPKDQIAYLLESKKGEIAKMLPKHLNAERLMKVAQIAATTTPALAKCDVASLVGAIAQCAQMGLEPNTVLGHAYLLPFNTRRGDQWVNSVQVIIGYKGLIDLARRSGQIVSIAAHEVCANDHFDLCYGLDEKLEHKPTLGERGEVVGFYAVAKLKDGGYSFEFMSRRQVEEIKIAGEKKNKRESAVWKEHFVEMGRKTVIRRLAKYLPLSIEFQTAVALDNTASTGGDQHIENTIDGEFNMVADEDAAMYGADARSADADGVIEHNPSPTMQPVQQQQAEPVEQQRQQPAQRQQAAPAEDEAGKIERALRNAKDTDTLDLAADLIGSIEDTGRRDQLRAIYQDRTDELNGNAPAQQAAPAANQQRAARGNRGGLNLE